MRHPDIIFACVNRFHSDTGLAPFYCRITQYFDGELCNKYDDRVLRLQPWTYNPPARAVLPNFRKLQLLPTAALMSASMEVLEYIMCKSEFVPKALKYSHSIMDVADYFSLVMKLLLSKSVSAASRDSYSSRFQARIREFEEQLSGRVAFGETSVPLEERLYEWEIEQMHVRCQRVEREMLQKWRGDGSSALPFVPKFPDLHSLRKRREKYLRALIPTRWMPMSSVPLKRLEQQRLCALNCQFLDSKNMQAILVKFVGQRLAQQLAVQSLLLVSRQVANFTQLPAPHIPAFVNRGLESRFMSVLSLEIEKLTRMHSTISSSAPDDSSGLLQLQLFLMNSLLRARIFGCLASRAIKCVVREVFPVDIFVFCCMFDSPHFCRLSSSNSAFEMQRQWLVSFCAKFGIRVQISRQAPP
jgi:hypothetical protein